MIYFDHRCRRRLEQALLRERCLNARLRAIVWFQACIIGILTIGFAAAALIR